MRQKFVINIKILQRINCKLFLIHFEMPAFMTQSTDNEMHQ